MAVERDPADGPLLFRGTGTQQLGRFGWRESVDIRVYRRTLYLSRRIWPQRSSIRVYSAENIERSVWTPRWQLWLELNFWGSSLSLVTRTGHRTRVVVWRRSGDFGRAIEAAELLHIDHTG